MFDLSDKISCAQQHHQLDAAALYAAIAEHQEGEFSAGGVFNGCTGHRTGRSPKLRFIVDNAPEVNWGKVNQPISQPKFQTLWEKACRHIEDKRVYSGDYQVGQDPKLGLQVRVVTEFAWHQLFVQHLFIRECDPAVGPQWQLLNVPTLQLDPEVDGTESDGIVILNLMERKVLLIGMRYAGEMKKAMFTCLNYLLPPQNVLPMHCAANMGKDGQTALFFGLSGTGKTTLSADKDRLLIGDDEHGWGDAVFNFEGGCYAKCIDITAKSEPVIYDAIKPHAVMENVVLDSEGHPDFSDDSLTQNTRVAYPREHIEQRVLTNRGQQPSHVIFLCCDLFGVLPPVAQLTTEQAAYYFLSGYTALVGSTEMGSGGGVKPTFSTCFGAPFFPRHPQVYSQLLINKIKDTGAKVYLVNTGWSGGGYHTGGKRFDLKVSRAVVTAITSGALDQTCDHIYPGFNFKIPSQVEGVDAQCLNPENSWADKAAYHQAVQELVSAFKENEQQFADVADAILQASPEASVLHEAS